MKSKLRILSGMAAVMAAGVLPLTASTVTYDFGQASGGAAPGGTPPWLQAVFSDNGLSANTVQLTLTAKNLVGNEFVSGWYFNLNPTMDPTALSFSLSGSNPSIQTGANAFKAGPDGKYDLVLGFSTVAGSQFGNGDSLTMTISGIGLTANDFDYLSTAAAGCSPYASAAHIESIDQGDLSGWINPTATTFSPADDRGPAVPDGSETILLLGASLLGLECVRRAVQPRLAAGGQ
ncbi:MAG TPA: hypothetical protein VG938_00875 [Verrucomicrobiae bacterium]|jgi:hypothetical protein|nr:hypothetical protein [Verrucomicrobiae bacterium]